MFLKELKKLKLTLLNSKKLKIDTFGGENPEITAVQPVNFFIKTADKKLIDRSGF